MDYFLLTNDLLKPIGKLDNLTNGTYFCCSLPITSWDINLPSLTNGSYMFLGCAALTSFTCDLPVLLRGDSTFYNCRSLTSFTSDLPALTDREQHVQRLQARPYECAKYRRYYQRPCGTEQYG